MAERGDPHILKHVVIYLRTVADKTQEEFAEAVGTTQAHVSNYERAKQAPPDAALRRMARVAGVPWHVVQHLRRFLAAAREAVERGTAAGAPVTNLAVLDNVLLAAIPYLVEETVLESGEALREGREVLATLEPLAPEERRQRIDTAPPGACRSWAALVKVVCEASARAAADNAERALELADLALSVAERVPPEELGAARAYAWGYLGNARRVANDHDGAGEALAHAWELWRPGSPWFPEWRPSPWRPRCGGRSTGSPRRWNGSTGPRSAAKGSRWPSGRSCCRGRMSSNKWTTGGRRWRSWRRRRRCSKVPENRTFSSLCASIEPIFWRGWSAMKRRPASCRRCRG